MISLSDSELSVIMDAAKPLQPHQRSEFLQAVASELQRYPEIGVGIVSRVTAKLQRQHLNPPRRYAHSVGKWDR